MRLGAEGEAAAERFLRDRGLEILERRFRTRLGEIDLIAADGGILVFVEVKLRTGRGFGAPAEAVTPRKRARIARVAQIYLVRRGAADRRCRFDVIEVTAPPAGTPEVRHIRDAFRLWPTG